MTAPSLAPSHRTHDAAPRLRPTSAARPPGEQPPTVARPVRTLRETLAAIPDSPRVHVDVRARLLTVNDQRVHLSTKEFDLLAALATAEGRVLTRDELQATVWRERPVSGSSRTVDVHVWRLRRVPALADLIATARGTGYRIPERRHVQVTT